MWQKTRRVAVRHAMGVAYSGASVLPAPVRAQVRRVAMWGARRRPPVIENWSEPLIRLNKSAGASPAGLVSADRARATPGVVGPTVRPRHAPAPAGAGGPGLRCLVVTTSLDVGGMEEVVAFLARRLPVHGFRTAVLRVTASPSARAGGRLARMLQSSGVEVDEISEEGALRWIQDWHPDVISAHGPLPDRILAIAYSAAVPYVETLHDMRAVYVPDWQAEAERAAKVTAIVAVSEIVRRQYLARSHGFPPDRIVTIPNGVDDERRLVADRSVARERLGLTDEYLFAALGRHCVEKNAFGLVTAFAEVARRRTEAHLVIAGHLQDIRYYRQVLRLRDSLPCRDRVHLRDHIAAPATLLAAADGFVLDSFHESGPLVSMEALFAGVPVVLSDVGGAREQVGGNPARGYLVANPLGDPLSVTLESMAAAQYRPQANRHEFAAAMECLIAGRADYLANRQQLAAESAGRFSAGTCLARYATVLRAAAAEVSPAGLLA